jgi:hypothetical protein
MRGWGDSLWIRVNQVLAQYCQSWDGVAILLQELGSPILKMKNFDRFMSGQDASGMQVVANRALAMQMAMSVAKARVLDTAESLERLPTQLGGVAEVLREFALRLAAASGMPFSMLMGQVQGGLGDASRGDILFFDDQIAGLQRKKLLPALRRFVHLQFAATEGVAGGKVPRRWSVSLRPQREMTDAERADYRKKIADVDAEYIARGVVTAEEVASTRFGSAEYNDGPIVLDLAGRTAAAPVAPAPAVSRPPSRVRKADVAQTAEFPVDVLTMDTDWDESMHPRGEHGRFVEAGAGPASPLPTNAPPAAPVPLPPAPPPPPLKPAELSAGVHVGSQEEAWAAVRRFNAFLPAYEESFRDEAQKFFDSHSPPGTSVRVTQVTIPQVLQFGPPSNGSGGIDLQAAPVTMHVEVDRSGFVTREGMTVPPQHEEGDVQLGFLGVDFSFLPGGTGPDEGVVESSISPLDFLGPQELFGIAGLAAKGAGIGLRVGGRAVLAGVRELSGALAGIRTELAAAKSALEGKLLDVTGATAALRASRERLSVIEAALREHEAQGLQIGEEAGEAVRLRQEIQDLEAKFELVVGRHFRSATIKQGSKFTKNDQEAVLILMDREPTRAVLDQLNKMGALSDLDFRPVIGAKDLKLDQVFNGETKNGLIKLATDRSKIGLQWKPGPELPAVSCTGRSVHEAVALTGAHEVAHHLIDVARTNPAWRTVLPEVENKITTAFTSGLARPVSRRARDDAEEYFAETFAAYTRDKAALRAYDPVGANLVENVLQDLGVHIP